MFGTFWNSLKQLGRERMGKSLPAVINQKAVNAGFLTVTPQGFGVGSKAFRHKDHTDPSPHVLAPYDGDRIGFHCILVGLM